MARRVQSLLTVILLLVALAPPALARAGSGADVDPIGTAHVCPPPTPPKSFADSAGTAHAPDISCAAGYGIVAGYPDGSYQPSRSVSRAAMATFIVRELETALDESLPAGADAFVDDNGKVHEQAINKLARAGIVAGVEAHRYNPSAAVTRDQLATFMANAIDYQDNRQVDDSLPPSTARDWFADDNGDTHEGDINRLAAHGIVQGFRDGRYHPRELVTRAQMAAFVMRTAEYEQHQGAWAWPRCTADVSHGVPPTNAPAAILEDVRVATHPESGFDRVVFDFRDDTSLPGFTVGYRDVIREDPSDRPLALDGKSRLLVDMRWAEAHANGSTTVPAADLNLRPGLPMVKQVRVAGDFEAVLSFGIGVGPATRPQFRAWSLPGNRVIVDVAHPGRNPWLCGKVFFVDTSKIIANIDPPVTGVDRRLPTPAVATAAMNALFFGPSPAERDRHLTFVDSHATGFADLRVARNQVASLRVLGPISSDGSAVATIATEIFPTLKQFPTVRWVKIYDEDGLTSEPTGQSDSIPLQLNP